MQSYVKEARSIPNLPIWMRNADSKVSASPIRFVATFQDPDGQRPRLVSASGDNTITIWDLHTGERIFYFFMGSPEWILPFAVFQAPNGQGPRLVSYSCNGRIRIWDLDTGKCAFHFPMIGNGQIRALAVFQDPDGQGPRFASASVSASGNSAITICDLHTGERVFHFPWENIDRVHSVVVFQDTDIRGLRIISTSEDGTIEIWNPYRRELICTLTGHLGPIYSVAVFEEPDRQEPHLVSTSEDGTVKVWNLCKVLTRRGPLPRRREPSRLLGNTAGPGPSASIGFVTVCERYHGSPLIVSCSQGGVVKFWRLNTGRCFYKTRLAYPT
ncbi:MAG: hypothetical protein AAF355_09700 [Myxococcota bacterium]